MAVSTGTDIVNSGLILHINASNQAKSWLGAPTTNNLSVPTTFTSWQLQVNCTVVAAPGVVDALNSNLAYRYSYNGGGTSNQLYLRNFTPTANVTYTSSCYFKYIAGDRKINFTAYTYGTPTGYNGATITCVDDTTLSLTTIGSATNVGYQSIGNGWFRVWFSFVQTAVSASVEYNINREIVGAITTFNESTTWDLCYAQLEASTFPTPFTNGTRSATQALNDLTNLSTVTASSLIYNSDNTFSFNASKVVTVPMANLRPTTQITQECWFSTTTNSLQVFIGSQYGTSSNNSYALWLNAANTWCAGVNIGGSLNNQSYTQSVALNTYYHFVHTYDGSNQRMYINGVLVKTWATTGSIAYDTNNTLLAVGNDWNGAGYDTGASIGVLGNMPVVRIYNRALTSTEVLQNFEAERGRYNV